LWHRRYKLVRPHKGAIHKGGISPVMWRHSLLTLLPTTGGTDHER
jgi:hypothetical protein